MKLIKVQRFDGKTSPQETLSVRRIPAPEGGQRGDQQAQRRPQGGQDEQDEGEDDEVDERLGESWVSSTTGSRQGRWGEMKRIVPLTVTQKVTQNGKQQTDHKKMTKLTKVWGAARTAPLVQ